MVTAKRTPKPIDTRAEAVNALEGDYAAIALLLIVQKQKVGSAFFIGKLMNATNSAWGADGRLDPDDLERLGLIRLEQPLDKSKAMIQLRITWEGEKVVERLLSSDDDRIVQIKRAVDKAADAAKDYSSKQISTLIKRGDTEHLRTMLAASEEPGKQLGFTIEEMNPIGKAIVFTLTSLGIMEFRQPEDGSDHLKTYLTVFGESVVRRLRRKGYSELVDYVKARNRDFLPIPKIRIDGQNYSLD